MDIELIRMKREADEALEWARELSIESPDIWQRAREIRARVKLLDRKIEEHYKEMKRPWDEGKKKILALEEEHRRPMLECLEMLDQKIIEYERELEERHREKQRALMNESLPPTLPDWRNWLDGEGRSELWSVDEESIDLMALVEAIARKEQPLTLIKPNIVALNALARALKESFSIPGCKVRKRIVITQREK